MTMRTLTWILSAYSFIAVDFLTRPMQSRARRLGRALDRWMGILYSTHPGKRTPTPSRHQDSTDAFINRGGTP